jgi:hypothetical protein
MDTQRTTEISAAHNWYAAAHYTEDNFSVGL